MADSTAGQNQVPMPTNVRAQMLARKQQLRRPSRASKMAKKSQSRIVAKEKQRKALELRKAGVSYVQIAETLGYADESGARKAIDRAFSQVTQEPVLQLRVLQIERLNHMLMTLWPQVQAGNENSIRTSLQVMDKLDRLLGTEAATQVDVNVNHTDAILVIDGQGDDYIKALRQMAAIQADGTNSPEGEDRVVIGEVIPQITMQEAVQESGPMTYVDSEPGNEAAGAGVEAATVPTTTPAEQAHRTFKFGVDPKVRRDDGPVV